MCYWVGTRKIREVLLQQLQKNPQDEIPQLFYKTFIDPPKPENGLELMEHPVAVGKAKPVITTLAKYKGEYKFTNRAWTLNWNFWDSKTKQEKAGRPLLNSRSENVFWQHKDLIYSKRCIIPVDGYWEFFHFKGQTYPYFIYPEHGGLFYLGGIWNEYVDKTTGEVIEGFSIITTPPNALTSKLHNNPKAHDGSRMLLIVDENQIHKFLDESLSKTEISKQFFKPYAAEKMKYHSTIRFLKKEFADYVNSGKVQESFEYPELVA
ncbi:MAG: SOS response-associated peptidase family protein [Salinivirgaceae bacterium]|jgi:putative SOS response-associated peptidase YedK|nr:SOS response-associated peptidase family protein [Salinivirgaceae bacterium]